ncbi:hypothetical protein CIPAW_10G012300 [Carya illinoinensis]|uniref:Bulb-type lectin domain-containing protein n=1 Tax=Carya illinoinensis TaxID=32201 RepID=A0A8T1PBE6_CARIL|nr:hypothetical protein CIPAW_10G012300 [Carya illinoinensis]
MLDTGNLMITSTNSSIIWESFKNPTNTILPAQVFSVGNNILSSRSKSNYQQGKFQLCLTDNYDLMLNEIDVCTKNPYNAYYRDQNILELILDKSGYLQPSHLPEPTLPKHPNKFPPHATFTKH